MTSPFTPLEAVTTRDQLIQQIDRAYRLISQTAATGIIPYLNCMKIQVGSDLKLFRDCGDPWQWTLISRLAPAFESVAGISPTLYTGPRNFWIGMPKGHSKTSFLAWLINWLLAYSKTTVMGYAAAGDTDQASILLDAMEKEASANPWLARLLFFKQKEAKGQRGSVFKILSADAKTSHGYTPDIIVLDEVTWWAREDLYTSLNAARIKKKTCIFLVITNAGILGTWQDDKRQLAKKSSKWFVYEAPGQIASWMSQEDVAELKKELPPAEAARMIDNHWLDPADSCGFVTRAEVEACANLGKTLGLTVRFSGEQRKLYLGSIDYGPQRDRTVCTVMHQEGDLVVVDRMEVWQGSKSARVPVNRVEDWIREVNANYNLACLVVDPAGLESTCQKFETTLPLVRYESRGGKGNYSIFSALRSSLVNQRVTWFPGCGTVIVKGKPHTIEDELVELITRKMSYGFRIDTLPNKHDDRAVALAQGLVQLLKTPLKRDVLTEGNWF